MSVTNSPYHPHTPIDDYFCEVVYNKRSEEGKKLFALIRKWLYGRGLTTLYDESDILADVYSRCRKNMARGTPIWNPYSYVKQVAWYRISELARQHPYNAPLEEDQIAAPGNPVETMFYEQVRERLKALSPLEHKLICLREVDRVPYDEIAQILVNEGFGHFTPANLRQLRLRIIKKLKGELQDEGFLF